MKWLLFIAWATVAQVWPPNMPDSTMRWFQEQQSKNGRCCADADGYPADWKRDGDTYFVFDDHSKNLLPYEQRMATPPHVEAAWREVPKEALILNEANPTGRAVIWYMAARNAQGFFGIRCFVAGPES